MHLPFTPRLSGAAVAAASVVVIEALKKHGNDTDAILAEFDAAAERRGDPKFANVCWAVAITLLT